jgi:hypothetical protein
MTSTPPSRSARAGFFVLFLLLLWGPAPRCGVVPPLSAKSLALVLTLPTTFSVALCCR